MPYDHWLQVPRRSRNVDPLAAPKADTIAYYGFQNNGNDTGPNALSLTAVNTPTYEAAVIGQGAVFAAASSQYFTVAHNNLMCPASGLTIVSRFRFTTSAANRGLAIKYHSSTLTERSYTFYTTAGSALAFALRTTGGETTLTHGSALSVDTNYVGIAMWDGATMSLRVVGVGSTASTARDGTMLNSSTVPLIIGAYPSQAPASFLMNGRIDTTWMVNRALTEDEITAYLALTGDVF